MLSIQWLLQIVSGSRDKTIKLWNTLGECKYTIGEPDGHTEWVSCVRFSPVTTNPIIVSAGWDKLVKVMLLPCRMHMGSALSRGQFQGLDTNTTGVAYQAAQVNVHTGFSSRCGAVFVAICAVWCTVPISMTALNWARQFANVTKSG